MRVLVRATLALAVLLTLPALADAQRAPRVKIDAVRFGLPCDNWENTPQFRAAYWVPVYIDLTAGPEGFKKDQAWVVVEVPDSDEIGNTYSVPVPPAEPGESFTVLAYTRPGSAYINLSVSVRSEGQNLCPPFRKEIQGMDPNERLYLTVGSRLRNLRALLKARAEDPDRDAIAEIADVRYLPEHWFGYSTVDLLILTTGANRDFFMELRDDKSAAMERKRRALVEWVQRGGRLIISANRNQDVIGPWVELQELLPVAFKGTQQFPEVTPSWGREGGTLKPLRNSPPRNNPAGPPAPLEVARLERKPGRMAFTLLTHNGANAVPLIVQSAAGLGRVTVVAFDLDLPPVTEWESRAEFWRRLVQLAGGRPEGRLPDETEQNFPMFPDPEGRNSLNSQLLDRLEDYGDEVPVISFGWVALFILLYILIVGPLDYWFLKKVVNRLELTWITFPTVVITVSAAAYFAAYHIKGNELKINKVDIIDIDLARQETYGTTWFTLFSPRIQHYTIGVEPATPTWAAEPGAEQTAYPVVVTWSGRADIDRARGQSLFRRSYEYETNFEGTDPRLRGVPTGLKGVPIQVWSTKSFTATWQAPMGGDKPAVTAKLRTVGDIVRQLDGEITSHLPMKLEETVLLHGDGERVAVYELGTLTPGTAERIRGGQFENQQWFLAQQTGNVNYSMRRGRFYYPMTGETTPSLMKAALFFELSGRATNQPGQQVSNRSLRYLDQSWRLKHNPGEAILYGRLAPPVAPAEEVTKGAVSPSRLWLGALPGQGTARPDLSGTIRQETYVRVFIPIDTTP